MSGKAELKLTEDLIREALRLELDCIEIPPVDRAWHRVRSRLDQTPPSMRKPVIAWSRLAVVAAACLVIVLGGIGVFRDVQFSSPAADISEMPIGIDPGEEAAMLETEDTSGDDLTIMHQNDTRETKILPAFFAGPDPMPPDWMPLIAEEFVLNEAILLGVPEGPEYRGAYYSGNSADLLLVRSAEAGEDLALFINLLGRYIGFYLEDMGETNGFTRLAVSELPGLAWQNNGQNQALLTTSGFITEEELKSIASMIIE